MTVRADAQPTLTTARLVLRPLAPADAGAIERHASRFEIAGTTVNIPHPYPPGGAAAFIAAQQEAWRQDRGATWAVTRDGELIGLIGSPLSVRAHARARLGYWIAHEEWGRGYATEAARAFVTWAFADGWHRIEADHLSRNPASGRVMQKIGMRHEGHLRAYYRRFDRWEDVELYALLAGD
jgi:RimJ/RimL family protein N-acetyltransferase